MKIKNNIFLKVCMVFLISLLFITGCNKSENVDKEANKEVKKPIVAVSIVPQKTFVEAVCGDLVDVVILVPPGSSPETYEPSPLEVEKFKDSDIYFSLGIEIEEASILPNAKGIKTISLHEEVKSIYPERTFESGERDSHIWLSPKRVKVIVEVIAREMGIVDQVNKDIYLQNANDYIKEIEEADEFIKKIFKGVKNKEFIVFHPAFGYLAEDYGLEMYSVEEEGKEATVSHLQNMIDLAKDRNIKAIFYQDETDPSQSKAFAEEIGGRTIPLAPLSADYINNIKEMSQAIAGEMK